MAPNPASIFKGTAWYYARYRRPYPKELFTDLVSYYRLDGRGKLLDLGCGTGELAVPLVPYFESAVGIDPSQDMLAEARSHAEGMPNVQFVEGKAEDVDNSLAPIRLTTTGVSFHWMQKELVLEKIYALTEDGGGMAIIDDVSPVRGKDKTEDWKMRRKELITKYLGEDRRAGDDMHKHFIPQKRPFAEIIAESPFGHFEKKEYPYTTKRNIDDIIGFLNSTSYANKRILGDRADEFEDEMRSELLKFVPSNEFPEDGKIEVFLMRK